MTAGHEAAVGGADRVIEPHEPGRAPAGGPAAGPERVGVPLAELHVHLEATATPDLVRRLAARNGVTIPPGTIDGDRYLWRDFLDFLRTFDRAVTVVKTAEDYRDITYEYLAACAAEGAIYVEVTVSPDHADQAGLSYGDMLAGVAQGIDDARAATGIESRVIVTAVRNFGTERAEWVARTAAAHPHPYVTGFGLAGDEAGFPPGPFARAFEHAHAAGLGVTCHAGEWAGPESVRGALALPVPVTRLGHGVRAIEDPDLVRELAARGTVLEVCPTSNVVLGAYPDYRAHPFPVLRDAGVRVTLGSDDPPYWEATVGGEYAVARREWGLDAAALRDVTRTAIEAAFVPDGLRSSLLARIQQ
jgi:adenosine deaminase